MPRRKTIQQKQNQKQRQSVSQKVYVKVGDVAKRRKRVVKTQPKPSYPTIFNLTANPIQSYPQMSVIPADRDIKKKIDIEEKETIEIERKQRDLIPAPREQPPLINIPAQQTRTNVDVANIIASGAGAITSLANIYSQYRQSREREERRNRLRLPVEPPGPTPVLAPAPAGPSPAPISLSPPGPSPAPVGPSPAPAPAPSSLAPPRAENFAERLRRLKEQTEMTEDMTRRLNEIRERSKKLENNRTTPIQVPPFPTATHTPPPFLRPERKESKYADEEVKHIGTFEGKYPPTYPSTIKKERSNENMPSLESPSFTTPSMRRERSFIADTTPTGVVRIHYGTSDELP